MSVICYVIRAHEAITHYLHKPGMHVDRYMFTYIRELYVFVKISSQILDWSGSRWVIISNEKFLCLNLKFLIENHLYVLALSRGAVIIDEESGALIIFLFEKILKSIDLDL